MKSNRALPLIPVLALAAFLPGCQKAAEMPSNAPDSAPLVEATAARFGALPIEETLPGVVRARNQVAVRPGISGRVVDVLVSSGDSVRKGQALVNLDDSEVRERLRQAEADVRLARASAAAAEARVDELEARVARTRTLARQELVSAQELETQEAQLAALRAGALEEAARVDQALAAVDERRSALAKTVVTAPLAGRLGERRVEIGMQVDPSTVLFMAGDLDELIVELDLTEEMLVTVTEGTPVVLESRSLDAPIRAQLSRISPFLAEKSFTTRAEVDLDNREGLLRPGMFVNARIQVGESQRATLVPETAVWENPTTGERGVFVIEEDGSLDQSTGEEQRRAVVHRSIDLLAQGGGVAGVAGIEPSSWVVTVGQQLLAANLREAAAEAGSAVASTEARVRPVTWQRVTYLQNLQDEDLLEQFLDKQRKVAAALGAEIPASEDEVTRVLNDSAASGLPSS